MLWSLALIATLCWAQSPRESRVPALGALNELVVARTRSYPTDGTHRYHWPKNGDWAGNTRDMRYRGELFAKGDAKRRAYCCGLTFEVFFDAYRDWCEQEKLPFVIGPFDTAEKLRGFRSQWFGADGNRRCLVHALVANGLGVEIKKPEDARAGDFVQLWRQSGSGHSVIFDSWVTEDDRIVGIRYWSTQKSTKGVGYRVERFGGERGVKRDECWIVRVGRPPASKRGAR